MSTFGDVRKDFEKGNFDLSEIIDNPFVVFNEWLNFAIESNQPEPTAMSLSTSSKEGFPHSRIVLLKGADNQGFHFFTNYESDKGTELQINPQVAALFFWPDLERQIRIEGFVEKLSAEQSDAYFITRPRANKIGAWASLQSKIISKYSDLELQYNKIDSEYKTDDIPRPSNWGGYRIIPAMFEYWQGRPGRLHQRLRFVKISQTWHKHLLSP